MPSVDERIVRIEFDNSAFERKVGDTLRSIQRLNESLKFPDAGRGFSDISAAANKVDMGHVGTSIDGLSTKFLAMSTVAITVLANITNRAVDAGIQIARSLSLDSVIGGFREYELSIGSIQTILSNTRIDGTGLTEVSAALDELNRYADQTIYNFGQMTRNIGTFTAAGVDLDTSVQSIKGIANLAAISGSSAEQAASAMYQLSQAISTGTLRLIDWNSVVNAGMGGEVFQRALFTTGQALGTITTTRVGQTFDEWTAAGNTFRGSLEDNWLTAEVLTTTLQGFTGDLTEAQLLSIGYTQDQAREILAMGADAVEAATKVRTLSQLIDTTKEALQSGWSESFRIIFGDFEQATELFSGIADAIGGIVSRSSELRNEQLHIWRFFGGRDELIKSLGEAFRILGTIMAQVRSAFEKVFPQQNRLATMLSRLTLGFAELVDKLRPSSATLVRIQRIFEGLFSALQIGWVIIRETARFFFDLFTSVTGAGNGRFLEFVARIGDFLTELNDKLVEGGGIVDFFDRLGDKAAAVVDFIKDLRDGFIDLLSDGVSLEDLGPAGDILGDALGRLTERFGGLKDMLNNLPNIWEPFQTAMGKVTEVTDGVWTELSTFFSGLGERLSEEFSEADFEPTTDIVAVGLLGGIALAIRRFIGTFNLDELNGVFRNIGRSFEELTGVLSAMQAELRARALQRIAVAIGLLTASVVALSLIDSEALTRSLTAMAVGFGQLLAAFAVLTRISAGVGTAVSFTTIATGMTIIAGAMVIMAAATAIFATMDWDELGRGLTGVVGSLTAMTAAVAVLQRGGGGLSMIGVGAGMIAMATAMTILAGAVKLFSMMEWDEIGRGLAGMGGGLAIITAAMALLPTSTVLVGPGLLAVGVALGFIATAVLTFSTMDWGELGRGLAGMAGALAAIALAMNAMPVTSVLTGPALIAVAYAIQLMADALVDMGGMSWSEIGRGLTAMAGGLTAIVLAMNLMPLSAPLVAAGLVIFAHGLGIMADVIEQLAQLSWGEIGKGIGALALALTVLGAAAFILAPVVPALIGLGLALTLLGAGAALFGAAALAIAHAFEILSNIDPEGLRNALMAVAAVLPDLVAGFLEGLARGIGDVILAVLELAPDLAKAIGALLSVLLDELKELVPKAVGVISVLISAMLQLIRERVPEYIDTGLTILLALLQGIRDNIREVVTLVGEIVVEFLEAFQEQFPPVAAEIVDTILVVFETVAYEVGRAIPEMAIRIVTAFFTGFWDGLESQLPGVTAWFEEFVPKILTWIGDTASGLKTKAVEAIGGFISGLIEEVVAVTTFFTELPGDILEWIGDTVRTLYDKGVSIVQGFKDGIDQRIADTRRFFEGLKNAILGWIGDVATALYDKGTGIIQSFYDGVQFVWFFVENFFRTIKAGITGAIGNVDDLLVDVGESIMNSLWDGLKAIWEEIRGWLNSVTDLIPWEKGPPSRDKRLLRPTGEMIMGGFHEGLKDRWNTVRGWLNKLNPADEMDAHISSEMTKVASEISKRLQDTVDFQPTITPVIDFSRVAAAAPQLAAYIPDPSITPVSATAVAQGIAQTRTVVSGDEELDPANPGGVTFIQNNNSPKALSTADIYRGTRNQLVMAKEALDIP